MEKGVAENDFVLLLVTKGYIQKATSRKGGVGFETDLITGEIVVSGNRRKFIPVLVRVSFDELPPFLKGTNAVVISDLYTYDKEYEILYRALTQQEMKKPSLGKVRILEDPPSSDAPFDIDRLKGIKRTPDFCYWDIWINSESLSDRTLPQLFPLYQANLLSKQAGNETRPYPFIFDPRNKKSHYPELVYESADYAPEINCGSYDKAVLSEQRIRYSYIDLSDNTPFAISPRFVEGTVIALVRVLAKIHEQLQRTPNVSVTVRIRCSKPALYLESRSIFDFPRGGMDSYFIPAGDHSLHYLFGALSVSECESLWQKIHGQFFSDQPKSHRPFLQASSSEFRRAYGRLLNASDWW